MTGVPARRTLRRALTVAALLMAAGAGPVGADGAPRLVVQDEHIDLGVVQGAAPVRVWTDPLGVVKAGDSITVSLDAGSEGATRLFLLLISPNLAPSGDFLLPPVLLLFTLTDSAGSWSQTVSTPSFLAGTTLYLHSLVDLLNGIAPSNVFSVIFQH